MNDLPSHWANEERDSWDSFWDKLREMPLLYLHGILAQLDRRIAAAVNAEYGAGSWDDYFYDTHELGRMAREAGMRVPFRNFEKLCEIVRHKEQQEILQLTGRAA